MESHVAGRIPTFAQLKELFNQIDLGTITSEDIQELIGRNRDRRALARKILGNDFISPQEIADAWRMTFTIGQLEDLEAALPGREVLEWIKKSGKVLMPLPPDARSLVEIRAFAPELFYTRTGGWYANEDFANNERIGFGWIAFSKEIIPDSTSKPWKEQMVLLDETNQEIVPTAAEFAWCVCTYYKVRGIRLFRRIWARTASVDSDGVHVNLGNFDPKLSVLSWFDDGRGGFLGLAPARRFLAEF